jgi:hypothetical protein
MSRHIKGISVLAIGIALGIVAESARAGTITLTDQNSAVTITPSSSAGLSAWTVNGTNIAVKQWFWDAVGIGQQTSLDTLSAATTSSFITGSGTEGLVASYSGTNGLTVKVIYMLTGGSVNGESDLQETIALTNTSGSAQLYRFYQYSNYNLSGNSTDSITYTNANTVTRSGDGFTLQTALTPVPNDWEGNTFPNTLNNLTSGSGVLSNSPAVGGSVGPGNVTWTSEWTPTIAAGATVIISEDQLLNPFNNPPVPEPSTCALLVAAGVTAAAARFMRRRRARSQG